MSRIHNILRKARGWLSYYRIKFHIGSFGNRWTKVNLCGGPVKIDGYCNLDIYPEADVYADLEKKLLPFHDGSIDALCCISAINYFCYNRGRLIVKDVFRVLKQGGIARFATQDLRVIAQKYVDDDKDFFFQKLPSGKDRFPGKTVADKINAWFYGYESSKKSCKYFYDYDSLAELFKEAGFSKIERKDYMQSTIKEISRIDNRRDQMFFLEAVK